MKKPILCLFLLCLSFIPGNYANFSENQSFEEEKCQVFASQGGTDQPECGSAQLPCFTLAKAFERANSSSSLCICVSGDVELGKQIDSSVPYESLIIRRAKNSDGSIYIGYATLSCRNNTAFLSGIGSMKLDGLNFEENCRWSIEVDTPDFHMVRCNIIGSSTITVNPPADGNYTSFNVSLYQNDFGNANALGEKLGVNIKLPRYVPVHFNMYNCSGGGIFFGFDTIMGSKWTLMKNRMTDFMIPNMKASTITISDNVFTRFVHLINLVDSKILLTNNHIEGFAIETVDDSQIEVFSNKIGKLAFRFGKNSSYTLTSNTIDYLLMSATDLSINIDGLEATSVVMVTRHTKLRFAHIALQNCNIWGNTSRGLYLDVESTDVNIIDCNFNNNSAVKNSNTEDTYSVSNYYSGGAIFVENVGVLTISSTKFINNHAQRFGGAISIQKGTLFLHDITFSGNTANIEGSDMWTNSQQTVVSDLYILVSPFQRSSVSSTGFQQTNNNLTIICPLSQIFHNYTTPQEVQYYCSCCPSTTYTFLNGQYFNSSVENPQCLDCPARTQCEGGGKIQTAADTWCHEVNKKLECLSCPAGYCNSSFHLWDTSCVGYRTGDLCGACQPGYSVSVTSPRCIKNEDCKIHWVTAYLVRPTLNLFFLALVPLGAKTEWKTFSYVIQIYPVLTTNNWLRIISTSIGAQSLQFSGDHGTLDFCIYPDMKISHRLAFELGSSILLILLALVGFIVALIGRSFIRYNRTKHFTETDYLLDDRDEKEKENPNAAGVATPERWCATIISGGLWVFSAVIVLALQLFRCVEISGEKRLFIDGTQKCLDWSWAVLVIVCLLPLFIQVLRMYLHSRKDSETATVSLLVLEACYREGYKWWEVVSLSRKTLLVAAYVFLNSDMQALILFLLCQCFVLLHSAIRPMENERGNVLETFCLIMLSIVSGMELLRNDSIVVWSNIQESWLDTVQAFCIFSALAACVLCSAWGHYPRVAEFIQSFWKKLFYCRRKKEKVPRESSMSTYFD